MWCVSPLVASLAGMTEHIIAEKTGHAGIITLNRPKALNSLTLDMVNAISAALTEWENDDDVAVVIVRGAGERGLCAGGDIVAMYNANKEGTPEKADAFFKAEYAMNKQIADYPKPYVALMNGIVLGGGVGVSAHGSHRIVTDSTRLGMPETGIGLFPDVGAAAILVAAPDYQGRHLALTGVHVGAAEAIEAGFADYFVVDADLEEVVDRLVATGDPSVIDEFAGTPDGGFPDGLAQVYAAETVEEILANLEAHGQEWSDDAAAAIKRGCPMSLKVGLEAQKRAKGKTVHEVLDADYRIATAIHRRADLSEGVRAQVIDKDRNPQWSPAKLEDISDADVDAIFEGAQ